MEYNLILPVAFKDYPFLKKTVQYIEKNLSPKKIFIITNQDMSCCIPSSILKHKQCILLDEDTVIPNLNYAKINNLLHQHIKTSIHTGWYYQQFLKIGFANSLSCDTEYYLSWDADTLPINKITFFTKNGYPFFTMKDEYHPPYFETIKNLFGFTKFNNKSYITEYMMFKKDIIKDFIKQIEQSGIEGESWFEKIINATNPNEAQGFSEFETYGNFCLNKYPKIYHERTLPGFRYGGFISGRFINDKILKRMSSDLFTISFETYHVPPFPWSIASWLYDIYIKKIQYKEYRVKSLWKKYYPL